MIEAPEKEDYGDLDILYLPYDKDIGTLITDLFSPRQIVTNGDVISFDYQQFQIDLIKANSPEELACQRFYLGYGDIGHVARFYRLRFGQKGLWIDTIDHLSLNVREDLILSTNPEAICQFLDYDYSRHQQGFTDKQQLFDWLMSSKYFIPQIFLYHSERYKKDQTRRKVYQQFLNHLDQLYPNLPVDTEDQNLQALAIDYFSYQASLDQMIAKDRLQKVRKQKFNGNMLSSYNLSSRLIGTTIKQFQQEIINRYQLDFWSWVDNTDHQTIKTELDNFISKK